MNEIQEVIRENNRLYFVFEYIKGNTSFKFIYLTFITVRCATLLVIVRGKPWPLKGGKPWPLKGATQYHAQLGLPGKDRPIKELVVSWVLPNLIPWVIEPPRSQGQLSNLYTR